MCNIGNITLISYVFRNFTVFLEHTFWLYIKITEYNWYNLFLEKCISNKFIFVKSGNVCQNLCKTSNGCWLDKRLVVLIFIIRTDNISPLLLRQFRCLATTSLKFILYIRRDILCKGWENINQKCWKLCIDFKSSSVIIPIIFNYYFAAKFLKTMT